MKAVHVELNAVLTTIEQTGIVSVLESLQRSTPHLRPGC